MARLAAFSVLVSSGTVLTAIGMGQVGVTGGALFYLISSTMGLGAFFLLIELVERGREAGADVLAVTREVYGEEDELEESEEVGIAIPATMGILGIAFIGCAVMISGLPPLSGFIAKFAVLTAALNPPAGAVPVSGWILLLLLILSGLAALIAMTRAGIRAFWAAPDRTVPRVRLIEIGPVAVLLLLCAIQTIQAGPVMRFMQATAQSLHAPQDYIRGVLGSAGERPTGPGGPACRGCSPVRERAQACSLFGCCSISHFRRGISFWAGPSLLSGAGRFRRWTRREHAHGGSAFSSGWLFWSSQTLSGPTSLSPVSSLISSEGEAPGLWKSRLSSVIRMVWRCSPASSRRRLALSGWISMKRAAR